MRKINYVLVVLVFGFLLNVPLFSRVVKPGFGGFKLAEECYNFIMSVTKEQDVLIELGSGWSTKIFSDKLKVYTVEDNPEFLNENRSMMTSGKYMPTIIYAPIVDGWYDTTLLKKELPKKSKVVFVDGPKGKVGRWKIAEYFALFKNTEYVVFDDVERPAESELLRQLAKKYNKPYRKFSTSCGKKYGVIYFNK